MKNSSAHANKIKQPKSLSPRIQWLRNYYFFGNERKWNNSFTCWSTGTPWDIVFNETTYYIVPETFLLLSALGGSYLQAARTIPLHTDFWKWSLAERRAWFVKEVIVNHVPKEILPGDLLAGARFNIQTSMCFNEKEAKEWNRFVKGKRGVRAAVKWFHDHGYGNAGATSGHLIPGHERLLKIGWKGIHAELVDFYNRLSNKDKKDDKGAQLRAMITASTMARDRQVRPHRRRTAAPRG